MTEPAGNVVELLPDLLARCRTGERAAFDTLVHRFHPFAHAVATSLAPTPDLADDATQAAFLAVLTHLPALRDPAAFPGWLRQIVRTECNRLARRPSPGPLPADQPSAPTANPAEHQEVLTVIRHAIAGLPQAQRQTVELFYLDDLQQSQIAATLSIPEGTVKRRLHDARNALRSKLKSQLPL